MARVRYHLAASAVLAGLYVAAGNRRAAYAAIGTGVFVDLDHAVDFVVARRTTPENLVVAPLHGWELVPFVAALDLWLRVSGGLVAGYLVHLTIDQLSNRFETRFAYLLAHRAWRGFRLRPIRAVGPEGSWHGWPIWRWL